ncbi:hypothetical protein SPYCW_3598 [Sphingopyxis sp. EG6]|nr:hypothetical protein SPYCW_3598 [Sphingopyxis sp. EG6]
MQSDLKPFRLRLFESREGRSKDMERIEVTEEVIDLGKASAETKGGGELILDSVSTEQNFAGLSDD